MTTRILRHVAAMALVAFVSEAQAQCVAGGPANTVAGIEGGQLNTHPFQNQCLAADGTNVTITIEAMADLGCNAFDAVHEPSSGGCPDQCTPVCCDTSPQDKYITVTANSHALTPAVSGSTNMPANGRFFAEWDNDCQTSSQACLEAGRSPCDPQYPAPNRRIVTIPAATWNSWLGQSGDTMTIRVTASGAAHSAPMPERSLALYCEELGFQYCPS